MPERRALSFFLLPFKHSTLYFGEQFQVRCQIKQKVQRSPTTACCTHAGPPSRTARAVPLLHTMILHQHILTTRSPHLTLGSSLGVEHSAGLDNFFFSFHSLPSPHPQLFPWLEVWVGLKLQFTILFLHSGLITDPENAPGDGRRGHLFFRFCSHSGHLFIEEET